MKRKTRLHGVSLVDLMIGFVLITIIMLGAFVSLRQIGMGRAVNSLNNRVDNKLRSVSEQIRYDSATGKYATWDQVEPDRDWTIEFDAAIKVTSHVDAENTETRSRKVTLVATWVDVKGMAKTRTEVFYVTRTRAKTQPGTAYVRVVERDRINVGIPGVRVWVQSSRGMWPPEGKKTDATGLAKIEDVMLGTDIPVTVDGKEARAFFMYADEWKTQVYPTTPMNLEDRTWRREDFRLDELKLGALENHNFDFGGRYGPIRMTPPGHLHGRVENWDTDSAQPSADGLVVKLYLMYEADGLTPKSDMPYAPGIGELVEKTKADGSYSFDNLVPGTYFPVSLGDYDEKTHSNNVWAAQARLGDANYANDPLNSDWIRVDAIGGVNSGIKRINAGGPSRPAGYIPELNFMTARKGTAAANARDIKYIGGIYKDDGPAGAGMSVTFYRVNTIGYHDASMMPGIDHMNFASTAMWQYELYDPTNNNTAPTTDVHYPYVLSNAIPLMINPDITATHPISGQFNTVIVQPNFRSIGGSLTPIRVYGIDPSGPYEPKFIVTNKGGVLVTSPFNTVIGDYPDLNVKVGPTPATKQMDVLDRSCLGRVTGTIMKAGVPFTGDGGRFYINFGTDGFGALQGTPGDNFLDTLMKATDVHAGPPKTQTYDTGFTLPPNLTNAGGAMETTRIYYETRSGGTWITKTFSGQVTGTAQFGAPNPDGSIPINVITDASQVRVVSPAYIAINAKTYKGNNMPGDDMWTKNVQVVNGAINFDGDIEQFQMYSGNAPATVAPGVTTNVDIPVVMTSADSGPVVLNFVGPNWLSSDGRWACGMWLGYPNGTVYRDNGAGYVQDWTLPWNPTLGLLHRIRYVVQGTVKVMGDGTPLKGAIVHIQENLGQPRDATVQADPDGSFSFPVSDLSPSGGYTDLFMQVVSIPVTGGQVFANSQVRRKVFSDNLGTNTWTVDFLLTAGGSDSGGGGQ